MTCMVRCEGVHFLGLTCSIRHKHHHDFGGQRHVDKELRALRHETKHAFLCVVAPLGITLFDWLRQRCSNNCCHTDNDVLVGGKRVF